MIKSILNKIILRLLNSLTVETKSILYLKTKDAHFKLKYKEYRNKYSLSDSFKFNGIDISFYGEGKIIIGNSTYIGNYSTIQSHDNQLVVIGRNCAISHNVRIYTYSYNSDQDFDQKQELKSAYAGDVSIGNGVWIGANVLINPGVVIGDNVVIGANAVITKDLKENSVYGGVPARFIKSKSLNGDT